MPICEFIALSEETEPAAMIATLDAWFDRLAGAVHVLGGEVLKFIGDGVLAIFPGSGAPAEACEAARRPVTAARAGMAHLDATRQAQGFPPLPFSAALHLGEILWGNIGAADRLDFTASAPRSTSSAGSKDWTGRSAGRCEHALRGIALPALSSLYRRRERLV